MPVTYSSTEADPAEVPLTTPIPLKKLNPQNSWLAERWFPDQKKRAKPALFSNYKGDPHDAFWYFDKEMAEATEAYYVCERGKKEQYIGFIQKGELLSFNENLHARTTGIFEPETDGLTFHLKAAFTDTLRSRLTNDHAAGTPVIDRICGPVVKVNDSTFTVRFYRMGLNNPKRTGDIWLLAHHPGDKNYKSTVQQYNLRIPFKQENGDEQTISFGVIPDQVEGVKALALTASSSSGLPVYFYVKEGPAEVKNGRLVFSKIPPRSKFPAKVTVVAWQYGNSNPPEVQTALPVEQSFFVEKKDE